MNVVTRTYSRCIAMLVACALLAVSAPVAQAKSLTPLEVHARILKRGIGNWVGVELQNGTAFAGRIVTADDQSFGLQLHNDPAITPIQYSDVVGLHTGVSNGVFWTFLAIGIGGAVAMTAVGIHELHTHDQMPTQPALP